MGKPNHGKILRSYLKLNDLSVEDLKVKMNVSRQSIYNWFEKTEFDEDLLLKLEKKGGISQKTFTNVDSNDGRTIGERVKEVRTYFRLNQEEFAIPLEVTQSAVSYAETSGNSVSLDLVQKISKIHNINIDWLINGNGEMLSEYSESSKTGYNKMPTPLADEKLNMWVIPIKAYGGFLQGYENRVFMNSLEKESFSMVKGECFKFEVEGYSMVNSTEKEKSYLPGNHIVCTVLEGGIHWCRKGKVYLFQCIDGMTLKEFVEVKDDKCKMRAYNDDYNPLDPVPLRSIKKVYHIEYKLVKPD